MAGGKRILASSANFYNIEHRYRFRSLSFQSIIISRLIPSRILALGFWKVCILNAYSAGFYMDEIHIFTHKTVHQGYAPIVLTPLNSLITISLCTLSVAADSAVARTLSSTLSRRKKYANVEDAMEARKETPIN